MNHNIILSIFVIYFKLALEIFILMNEYSVDFFQFKDIMTFQYNDGYYLVKFCLFVFH